MNARILLIPLCLSAFLPAGEIRLLNGDRVMGEASRMEGNDLILRPRWGEGTVAVPARYMGYLRLDPASTRTAPVANSRLHFVNGDNLLAQVTSLDGERCEMVASWGQTVAANPRMIRRIEFFSEPNETVISGLGNLSDWMVHRGPASEDVKVVGGAFLLRGNTTASRKLSPLPERYEMALRVNCRTDGYMFSLSPLLPGLNERGPGTFTLQFNRNNVFNRAVDLQGNTLNVWNERMPQGTGSSVALHLFADRRTGTFSLFVNDHLVRTWTQPGVKEQARERDRWFSLAAHNNGNLILESLHVHAWNGVLPQATPKANPATPVDQILLKNGDALQGQVVGLADAIVSIQVPDGPLLAVPIERIATAEFGARTRHEPRRENRDVEFRFHSFGEVLTLALEAFDESHATGGSEIWFDSLKLPREHLALLRFNIYLRRRLDTEDFDTEWIFQSHNPRLQDGRAPVQAPFLQDPFAF